MKQTVTEAVIHRDDTVKHVYMQKERVSKYIQIQTSDILLAFLHNE